jgi:tetratricopeptide (TPR) repeat protein
MWMTDPPSAALAEALKLVAAGKSGEAEMVVKKAAMEAKNKHGSGSHPLACAYADIARVHLQMGETQKAAVEFQHASKGPLPAETAERADRLKFMYGFGEALLRLAKFDEAEKVLKQCEVFAKNLHGAASTAASAAKVPLARLLLKSGKPADALKLAQEAFDALWSQGDPLIAEAFPARAEALKAAGRGESAFADLPDLPDDFATRTARAVLAQAPLGDPGRVRAVLADLLVAVDKKFGDGHAVTCDVLAAIAHHEARQGATADANVRRTAVRRSVWSFAVRRAPAGLLSNLEVAFEADGGLHLVPHLAREASPAEAAQLESVLTQAVDDLYAR